jgi:hypothetical protein
MSVDADFIHHSGLLGSVADRERVSQESDAMVPCQNGMVCRRESLSRSVCRNESGMLEALISWVPMVATTSFAELPSH